VLLSVVRILTVGGRLTSHVLITSLKARGGTSFRNPLREVKDNRRYGAANCAWTAGPGAATR